VFDDRDTVAVLGLLLNLICCDSSVVEYLCSDGILRVIGELANDKNFQIRKLAMWLCWNIVSLGSEDSVVRLLESDLVFTALQDSLDIHDISFSRDLVVPSCLRLMKKMNSETLRLKGEELIEIGKRTSLDGNEVFDLIAP
jgi:hypothetical protein